MFGSKEQPVLTVRAHIFQIDPTTRKAWIPSAATAVPLSLLHDPATQRHRVVALDGNKVLVNLMVQHNTSFTKTSAVFAQMSERGVVYGIGFAAEADLVKFSAKIEDAAKEAAAARSRNNVSASAPSTPTTAAVPPTAAAPTAAAPTAAAPTAAAPTAAAPSVSSGTALVRTAPPPVAPKTPTLTRAPASVPATDAPVPPPPPQAPAALPAGALAAATAAPAAAVPPDSVSEEMALLKYENERLKTALKTSSENAKQWEKELQTLRNNNARLKTALEESHANVEEWKVQLSLWKDESTLLKSRSKALDQLQADAAQQKMDVQTSKDALLAAQQERDSLQALYHALQQEKIATEAQLEAGALALRQSSVGAEQMRVKLHQWKEQFATKISELDELHASFNTIVTN